MSRLDVQPARIEMFVLDAPVENPVRNSFRTLTSRTSLLVRATDAEGAVGWGEVWCNYPPGAAAHRADLIERVIAPMIVGRRFEGPAAAFAYLESATRVPALQCGEPGSFAQAVAGIDIALWDLCARRAGAPLWRFLGGSTSSVSVYASGLGPDRPELIAERKLAEGHTAIKVKVGFDPATDERNLRELRMVLGNERALMVDANQRWSVDAAIEAARRLDQFGLAWIEEPIPADEPLERWQRLARATTIPLAAGENLRGRALGDAIASGALRVVQPDAGKWGGYSGCLEIARMAREAGVQFCPHWLGGGVGLMAALHLLAASGSTGWGEVDANPNPLRTLFLPDDFRVEQGRVTLSDAPGLGCIPDGEYIDRFKLRREPQIQ
jgi:L-alanine-DL-glutamate epimerase-like enolase superfamily enzyme